MTDDRDFLALQRTLAGRYTLSRELGRGGMGVVYLGQDIALERPVAIKLLPPALAALPERRERFLREARTAAKLSHPNIVPIHAVEEHGDVVCFVMGYVSGETLGDRVRRAGPMPAPDVVRLVREVAWALAYAQGHGVVHRDIKPDNVLLEHASGRAMVTDFGIARAADATTMTAAGEVVGTPQYMSPEQASGAALDGRSDLYSLGVVAFFALTGRLPFEAPTIPALLVMHLTQQPPPVASLQRDVPGQLAEAIDRCLAKDPAARFASGEELADYVAALTERARELPPPVRSLEREVHALVVEGVSYATLLLVASSYTYSVTTGAGTTVTTYGEFKVVVAVLLAVLWGMRLLQVVYRARQILAAGLTLEDVRLSLGAVGRGALGRDPVRDADLQASSFSALGAFLGGMGLMALMNVISSVWGGGPPDALVFKLLNAMFMVTGALISLGLLRMVIVTIRRRLAGRGGGFGRSWSGWFARALFAVAGLRLRGRVAPRPRQTGEPSELAVIQAIESLFAELPRVQRRRFADVPPTAKRLEADVRSLRTREVELGRATAEARATPAAGAVARGSAGVGPEDPTVVAAPKARRVALLERLDAARAEVAGRLEAAVTALENIRLDLLQLRAGVGSGDELTADLEAAAKIEAQIDSALAGREAARS